MPLGGFSHVWGVEGFVNGSLGAPLGFVGLGFRV